MEVAFVRAQQEIFQGSTGCCTCNWRKTSLWCTADRPWPSRACYSASSISARFNHQRWCLQTGFTCQGFWTRAKLAAPDSDRRTSSITLFYTTLELIPSYPGRPSLTVWFYEAKFLWRSQMTDLRRWCRQRRRFWTAIRRVAFLEFGILFEILGQILLNLRVRLKLLMNYCGVKESLASLMRSFLFLKVRERIIDKKSG